MKPSKIHLSDNQLSIKPQINQFSQTMSPKTKKEDLRTDFEGHFLARLQQTTGNKQLTKPSNFRK